MKILNLYCGLGGNRLLWGNSHNITAIDNNKELCKIYKEKFQNDRVICEDAKEYLLKNYQKFDFIWISPPCISHSRIRFKSLKRKNFNPILPDLIIYQYYIFLSKHFKGKFVIENVIPYYKPLIKPTVKLNNHYFWSNFHIPIRRFKTNITKHKLTNSSIIYNYDLSKYKFKTIRKDQALRNMVNPKIGEYILNCCQDTNIFELIIKNYETK